MSSQDGRLAAAITNPKVVVATTVALSFISFWRGASIVLSDLASSMFYAAGAAEAAVGKAAPRFGLRAMMFDYILTGPISVVSAGQYLGALLNEISGMLHQNYQINVNLFAAGAGILITIYFWWQNIKGVHESSGKALRIM